MDRIETISRQTAVFGGLMTALGQLMAWIGENGATLGVLVAFGGLTIQYAVARHNSDKADAEKLRNEAERRSIEAEERRKEEEHQLRMAILRGEIPDRRAPVDSVYQGGSNG